MKIRIYNRKTERSGSGRNQEKTGTVTKVPHKIGNFVTKGTALVEFADEE